MREIEIKARCGDVETLLSTLRDKGVGVSDPMTQDDRVFGLPGEKGDNINQAPWLRIRTQINSSGSRTIFTLKKTVTSQLDSIEHETPVEDGDELESIIVHLGFEPYVKVRKTRRVAHFGEIELCIDEVDGLETFVEAEKLTDESADYKSVIDELWKVFEELGIRRGDEVTDGYDVLIRKLEEK